MLFGSKRADGLTKGELGLIGWLEGDSEASLDAIGVEASGIVLVAEADGDDIGVDDGFTEGELTEDELGVVIRVEVEFTVLHT